ncbi:Coenzyme PQQ synthesis protein D (PqqD) [Saccharicrinis carchari]|uniref:Coenzyme PQQ synthesis protein D (PqqD) n=1 Tax=Saccharicrinis carchari TaxID=1168039 RepID=A0A521DM23_SACCC|nr:PqqD family protein [Saccharicrinis carchari]SMO72747.1 Coenzyme PQQ synthesis protein D (PqqD) [Saccharicrinis carchari]
MDVSLVYVKSEGFVEKAIGDEKVLVPLTDNVANMNQVYNLNEVAAFIYDTIDGQKNIAQVHTALINNYQVDQNQALDDITFFINDMVNRGILFARQ